MDKALTRPGGLEPVASFSSSSSSGRVGEHLRPYLVAASCSPVPAALLGCSSLGKRLVGPRSLSMCPSPPGATQRQVMPRLRPPHAALPVDSNDSGNARRRSVLLAAGEMVVPGSGQRHRNVFAGRVGVSTTRGPPPGRARSPSRGGREPLGVVAAVSAMPPTSCHVRTAVSVALGSTARSAAKGAPRCIAIACEDHLP